MQFGVTYLGRQNIERRNLDCNMECWYIASRQFGVFLFRTGFVYMQVRCTSDTLYIAFYYQVVTTTAKLEMLKVGGV